MRICCAMPLILALTLGDVGVPSEAAAPGDAAEVLAQAASNLSVTVYRAPDRGSGSIDLDALNGFALVSETRTLSLRRGLNHVRFEGVADGIEAASAIVTGLHSAVIEKNRDAALLSASALMAAAVGKSVVLLRTLPKTGKTERLAGTILSDAEGGVLFQTSQGIEGLRCSGLPESFSFSSVTDLSARPTLSVLVQSLAPKPETVTLSYLARGFDWAADYTATLSADGRSLDLGAWVTLANGNGVGFPSAHAQVVAGRVNRASGEVEPIDLGSPIVAQCWPRGSTSDSPGWLQIGGASPLGFNELTAITQTRVAAPMALQDAALFKQQMVQQEQLGDLKLYRVPDRTTVAARQSKQVRLLDRLAVPVTPLCVADLAADENAAAAPAQRMLRTVNDTAHHLGLPLPSGRIAVFAIRGGERSLEHESAMRDLAVNEELEIDMGESPDIQVTAVKVGVVDHVEISNAGDTDSQFELRLRLAEGARIIRADHPVGSKNGRPIFRLTIPAHEAVTVRYQEQKW